MKPPVPTGTARARASLDHAPTDVWIEPHALDRLRIHHPTVGVHGAQTLLQWSGELGVAAPLLGRSLEAARDRYFLTHDRQGVFVVRAAPGAALAWTKVTYLRLGAHQQEVAARLFGTTA